jgi:hypothetical protein
MQSLKEFFDSVQQGMENFTSFLEKSLGQLKLKMNTKSHSRDGINVIDTLNTTLDNVTFKVEQIVQGIREQSEQIQRELSGPLSMYTKHYGKRNEGMLRDANKIWTNLHLERTNMLFAKENFYNESCTLSQLRRSMEEDFKKGFEFKESP